MNIFHPIFYGTSAAEAIPSPFCRCAVCENARRVGGREIRRRSMLRLSDKLCLDLGADSAVQAMEYGDLYELEHVLVTHTHEDHFAYFMANVRYMASPLPPHTLHYYLTDRAFDIVESYRGNRSILKGNFSRLIEMGVVAFHRLKFGETAWIGGMEVTPLRGNHTGNMGENAANYLIRLPDGRSLYYGVDTGYYLPETFAALAGRRLGLLVSECTFGNRADRADEPESHLDFRSCLRVFGRLRDNGAIDSHTRIYLTHINHKHTATHADLERLAAEADFPCRITVAYDGMSIAAEV